MCKNPGLDKKKSTRKNPQIISIFTVNNKMTIESNRTTQIVPMYKISNQVMIKNGKLMVNGKLVII